MILLLILREKFLSKPKIELRFIALRAYSTNDITNPMAYGTQRFNAAFTNSSPIVPTLSRISPIFRIDTYFFTIHSNNVLPFCLGLPEGLFPVGLSVKIFKALMPSCILATSSAHFNQDLITLTILGERNKLLSSPL